LINFFRRGPHIEKAAQRLYAAIVRQARQPAFYLDCGVPDTPEGRFEMVSLHGFLLLHRLKRERDRAGGLSQKVFNLIFDDMDQNLRELGVSDLQVGKRVKSMAKSFYGRIKAYEEGLESGNATLEEALERNLFHHGDIPADKESLTACARYLRREAEALDKKDLSEFFKGDISFGPPPENPVAQVKE
jgi:cytochrome b pre-mRNA-processing protein 3